MKIVKGQKLKRPLRRSVGKYYTTDLARILKVKPEAVRRRARKDGINLRNFTQIFWWMTKIVNKRIL